MGFRPPDQIRTTLPQLNGNIKAIVEISKNSSRQVMSMEISAENIIKRMRPNSGSKNNPTCTVPAEHSVNKHAADDSYFLFDILILFWFFCLFFG